MLESSQPLQNIEIEREIPETCAPAFNIASSLLAKYKSASVGLYKFAGFHITPLEVMLMSCIFC